MNDARLAADIRQTTFGFPSDQVRPLLNHEASREWFLAAFGEFLLGGLDVALEERVDGP